MWANPGVQYSTAGGLRAGLLGPTHSNAQRNLHASSPHGNDIIPSSSQVESGRNVLDPLVCLYSAFSKLSSVCRAPYIWICGRHAVVSNPRQHHILKMLDHRHSPETTSAETACKCVHKTTSQR